MNTTKLVEKIQQEFSNDFLIEVYVLDNNGEPFEIFSGSPRNLTVSHVQQMVTIHGCFYVFSIVAIDRSLADSIDIQNEHVLRKEFLWLTDPLPPEVVDRGSDKMELQWRPITYCGIDPEALVGSLNYVLEVAEGQEYRAGVSSRFISELVAMEYRVMCRGPRVCEAVITELRPATWYHWRLTIEYANGTSKVHSATKPVPTLRAPPNAPSKPRLHVIPGTKSFVTTDGFTDSKLMVSWTPPACNGTLIDRYQLQVRELLSVDETLPEETVDTGKHTRWTTAYSNIQAEAVLSAPKGEVVGLQLRVRAKNADGWSHYSEVRTVTKQSHPSLFLQPAGGSMTSTVSLYDNAVQLTLDLGGDANNDIVFINNGTVTPPRGAGITRVGKKLPKLKPTEDPHPLRPTTAGERGGKKSSKDLYLQPPIRKLFSKSTNALAGKPKTVETTTRQSQGTTTRSSAKTRGQTEGSTTAPRSPSAASYESESVDETPEERFLRTELERVSVEFHLAPQVIPNVLESTLRYIYRQTEIMQR